MQSFSWLQLWNLLQIPSLLPAISVQMLEIDFGRLALRDSLTEWNAFGIKRIRKGDIQLPPSTPKPMRIELPRKEKPISKFPDRGFKNIGKVLVYGSRIEKKVEVQVVQIKKIKRIGGHYPYGPMNGTVIELKEPIFVVRRVVNQVIEPSYWDKLQEIKSLISFSSWLLPDNTTTQVRLPYRLITSDLRCRYCFAYWARQNVLKPENLYSTCCSNHKSLF